jgi:hypothetical protein
MVRLLSHKRGNSELIRDELMDSTPATKFGLRQMQSCGKTFCWQQLCMKALLGELGVNRSGTPLAAGIAGRLHSSCEPDASRALWRDNRAQHGEWPMNPTDAPKPESSGNQAAENIAEARQLLQTLQEQLGRHPALEEAIVKLELALSALTLQTGGLL